MSERETASPADDWDLEEGDFQAILGDDEDDAPLANADAAPSLEEPAAEPEASPAPTLPTAADEAASAAPPPVEGAPAAPAVPQATTQPLTTEGFVPPAGEPFAFTVDGQHVAVEGAVVAGDYIVIPKAAWDRQIRPNHLADRRVWREKERGYEERLRQGDTRFDERIARADAILARVQELNKQGPEAWAQWLDQFQTNAPLLEAQAREAATRQRLAQLEAAETQRIEQQRAEQVIPVLRQHLDAVLDQALATEPYKVLGAEAAALKATLWDEEAERLFFVPDRDDPANGLTAGQVAFRYDVLHRLLDRQAATARRFSQQAATVAKAAQHNAAAVAPPKPAPPKTPPRPRDPDTGQFAKGSKPSKTAWEDDLEADLREAFQQE